MQEHYYSPDMTFHDEVERWFRDEHKNHKMGI
jgi:hypothetical protein